MKVNKLTQLVEEVIKENKKQLEDLKKTSFLNSKELTIEDIAGSQSQFKEELSPIGTQKKESTKLLERKESKSTNLAKKLEKREHKIELLKNKIYLLSKENNELLEKLKEHEIFRAQIIEKLQAIDSDMTKKEKDFLEREKLLIEHVQEVETNKISIEEKYNKLYLDYTKELKLQKEEKSIEQMLNENKDLKSKVSNYEKMIELIIYFFRKIGDQNNLTNTISLHNFNPSSSWIFRGLDEGTNIENFTLQTLQQKLIELERSLVNGIMSERNSVKGNQIKSQVPKYINNSQNYDFEEMNSLSEKINNVTSENRYLKKQLKEYLKGQLSNLEGSGGLDKDQSFNLDNSINEEMANSFKNKVKFFNQSHANKFLMNKYNDLEKKFEEFQAEFSKPKKEKGSPLKRTQTMAPKPSSKVVTQNLNEPQEEVKSSLKKSLTRKSSLRGYEGNRKEESKAENFDNTIKELKKTQSPVVFNEKLTGTLFSSNVGPTSSRLFIRRNTSIK